MKNLLTLFFLLTSSLSGYSQSCTIEGPRTVCINEAYVFDISTEDIIFDKTIISAVTFSGGLDIPAALTTLSPNSQLEIIWLAGGAGELEIEYFNDGDFVYRCQIEVEVFGDGFYPTFGGISSQVGAEIESCGDVDIPINTLTTCTDCLIEWSVNDNLVQPDLLYESFDVFTQITGNIAFDQVGEYTLCYALTLPDNSCGVEDCVNITISPFTEVPSFTNSENINTVCNGTEVHFINTTTPSTDANLKYQWTAKLDTIQWTYVTEDLLFTFVEPGAYEISLQYFLASDPSCTSEVATQQFFITDQQALPISCNTDRCDILTRTYRTLNVCTNYEWSTDPSLGTIITGQGTREVTVLWNNPDAYSVSSLSLSTAGCPAEYCETAEKYVKLYPNNTEVTGATLVCSSGTETYTIPTIPEAAVNWSYETVDYVSGASPTLSPNDSSTDLIFGNYLGKVLLKAEVTLPNGDCIVTDDILIQKIFTTINENILCHGDVIIANIQPPLDEDVTWTITKPDSTSVSITQSGSGGLFFNDTQVEGVYSLSLTLDNGEEICGDDMKVNVLPEQTISLIGAQSVCPNVEYTYTIADISPADEILWTVFINGNTTFFDTETIAVTWPEDGFGFAIKVEVTPISINGIECGAESETFTIDIQNESQVIDFVGPTVVCRDELASYTINPDSANLASILLPVWSVDPSYIGSIIEGDSSLTPTIQWHYAGLDVEPKLILEYIDCSVTKSDTLAITFIENDIVVAGPLDPCQGTNPAYMVPELDTFSMLKWYVDGELVKEDENEYILGSNFGPGLVTVSAVVEDANGCPGISSAQIEVLVKESPATPAIVFDKPLPTCADEFDTDLIASLDNLIDEYYYVWRTNGEIKAEGLGNVFDYSEGVSLDDFIQNTTIIIGVTAPNMCTSSTSITLDFEEPTKCECDEEIMGSIDHLEIFDCHTVSFSGQLNWRELSEPQFVIFGVAFDTIIPILSEDDLTQDSIVLDGDFGVYSVGYRNLCPGYRIDQCSQDTLGLDTCIHAIDTLLVDPIGPYLDIETTCEEGGLTYTLEVIEANSKLDEPNFAYNISWVVNGILIQDDTLLLTGLSSDSLLVTTIIVENIDDGYTCELTRNIRTPDFQPEIVILGGLCEGDIWRFQPSVGINKVFDIFWDFGDGSGSTLYTTEKFFEVGDTNTVTLTITSFDGCEVTTSIDVTSHPNIIQGELTTSDGACVDTAQISFVNTSPASITTYMWSNGEVTEEPTLPITDGGLYTVTVTDDVLCTFEVSTVIQVNSSFPSNIVGRDESCGSVLLRVTEVPAYSYQWIINDEVVSDDSKVSITEPGTIEVFVVSIDNETSEVCDTLSKTVTVYSLPESPEIIDSQLYCNPALIEYTVTNYDEVIWTGANLISETSPSIQIAQNGNYRARVFDENGCSSSTGISVNENPVDFTLMDDYCIQHCREDVDSLNILINGVPGSFDYWEWSTLDSVGDVSSIATGNGTVESFTITDKMYDFIYLVVEADSCLYEMDPIFLDLVRCSNPPPPPCYMLEAANVITACLLEEAEGGPLYDIQISLAVPDDLPCTIADLEFDLDIGYFTNDIIEVVAGDTDSIIITGELTVESLGTYLTEGGTLSTTLCESDIDGFLVPICAEYTFPLDSCLIPEPDTCIVINEYSHECGVEDFKCIRSEEFGGLKFQTKARLRVPVGYEVCDEDLNLSFNAGSLDLLGYRSLYALNGDLLVEYNAVIYVDDTDLFEQNLAYISMDICSKTTSEIICIDYLLPYHSCSNDFACSMTYTGMDYTPYGVTPPYLFYNYCIALSDVVTSDCQLSHFDIVATIHGDNDIKEIYRKTYTDDFDTTYCIVLPILEADFESTDYYCLEIEVEGNCPGTRCGMLDCNMMMPNSQLVANENGDALQMNKSKSEEVAAVARSSSNFSAKVYPNPAVTAFNIAIEGISEKGWEIIMYDANTRLVKKLETQERSLSVTTEGLKSGVYSLVITEVESQERIVKRVIVIE